MRAHREGLALAISSMREVEKDSDYCFDHWSVAEEDGVIARLSRCLETPDPLDTAARELCDRLIEMGYGATSDKALPGEFDTVMGLLKPDAVKAEGTS